MTNKSKNSTIDRLKTMSKNSRGNFLRNNLRILKYGVVVIFGFQSLPPL